MPLSGRNNSSKAVSKSAVGRKTRAYASKEQQKKNADRAARVGQKRHEKKETQEKKAAEKAEEHAKKLPDKKKEAQGQHALETLAGSSVVSPWERPCEGYLAEHSR